MSWKNLNQQIIKCQRCPRLLTHCVSIARQKKRQFAGDVYWGRPVPGFGAGDASLWIIGLAPAAHGANRTGRMFTGDSSGDWLFSALNRVGLARLGTSQSKLDGNALIHTYISAAARCAPPDNRPTPFELKNCFPYLEEELRLLSNLRVILPLGRIAYDSTSRLLKTIYPELRPPKFGHAVVYDVGPLHVLASYHPSRQNTQTGRLTQTMWDGIFSKAKELLG